MSLSRILSREKKRQDEKVRIPAPTPENSKPEPEAEVEGPSLSVSDVKNLLGMMTANMYTGDPVHEPEEDDVERKKNFLFISDGPITGPIKRQLQSYTNIRPYDENFINRSTSSISGLISDLIEGDIGWERM